ncbi:MAG: hypothetical protein RL095_3719 [Verrucomicrobiota bacterium]|jgi:hypothetical protein
MNFRLASPADDAALRELLRRIELPGTPVLRFEAEPSPIAAQRVHGRTQLLVAEDDSGLLGCGQRAVAPAWLDGRPAELGYLGSLRLLPEHRGGLTLARGWRHFARLQEELPCDFHSTVIFSDNIQAQTVLLGGRAGLPIYRPAGSLHSPLLLSRDFPADPGIRPARDLAEVISLGNACLSRRYLAPVLNSADFAPGGRWVGLGAADFLVLDEGTPRGILGFWDQRAFRQTRIVAWGKLRPWRPLLNLALSLCGHRTLPRAGEVLPAAFASLGGTLDENPDDLKRLLRAALRRAHAQGLLGLIHCRHASDPLLPALRAFRKIDFQAQLYLVDGQQSASLKGCPYLEAACL